MEIVLASSRGKGLAAELSKIHPCSRDLIVHFKKSATYAKLLKELKEHWDDLDCDRRDGAHIYFLAGLCDLTYMDVEDDFYPGVRYEEVIFNEKPEEAVDRVLKSIREVDREVKLLGAEPVFCTVVPCSLRVWNHYRLNIGCSAFLQHHNHYEDMQHLLLQATQALNTRIIAHNTENNMQTPHIADTVIRNFGNGEKRVQYKRLWDGVHACDTLTTKWAKKLLLAMRSNMPFNYYV